MLTPPKGMKFPDIPLDAFQSCMVKSKAIYEIVYVGLLFLFGQYTPSPESFLLDRRRSRDVRHDFLLRYTLQVPIWNAIPGQDGPRRHHDLFIRDGTVSFGFDSIRHLREGCSVHISKAACLTNHHQQTPVKLLPAT